MFLRQITDHSLAQNAYLIGCQRTGDAIIVDPERDVDRYLKIAADNDFKITAVADTHIHADYLSGARELMEHHGATAYLSAEGGPDWQFEWAKGNPKACLLHDGDTFRVGNIELKAVLSAGHTPEHMSFLVTDIGGGAKEPMGLLSGDFIFVGDVGRPDLLESAAGQAGAMEPSARTLYKSLRETSVLSDHLQILPAHGAGSACGKALGAVPTSVLGYERIQNGALREALEGSEDDFVKDILSGQPEPPRYFARMKRDNKAGPPLLRDGKLPEPRRLESSELEVLVNEGKHQFLDLRTDRVAFMKQHVNGSLFAPIPGGKLPIVAGSYLEEDASIILLVNDASELDEAVRELIRIGLDKVEAWIPAIEALAVSGITSSQESITTTDLAGALAAHPDAMVLDVRGAGEFAESHVEGAKHIAYTRLAARLDEIPENQRLYVHCGSGLRASFAVSYLASQDREVVYVNGAFSDIPGDIKG
ncbi:MAG: MBL fold metallo-hydrolase [Verrucomicrobiales bacterium]|nr:MBL fold metallo-hydrolase [Verrucomicrobiales bacterium]HQZ30001.1 rhodanese-like domain-containing protein [Verrucomicrobiales bacterium]